MLEGDPAPGTNLTFFVPFESYSIYVSGSAGAIAFSSFAWDGGYQDGVLGGLWTTPYGLAQPSPAQRMPSAGYGRRKQPIGGILKGWR